MESRAVFFGFVAEEEGFHFFRASFGAFVMVCLVSPACVVQS